VTGAVQEFIEANLQEIIPAWGMIELCVVFSGCGKTRHR